ncbi:MAG: hypothetical protein HZB13_13435 [Acidobacteria bacterium]|nr:hypothetical protein [Acidobacteriota bacterium]
MHHVLKGLRVLTPEVADDILAGLGMCLLDMVEGSEMGAALQDRQLLEKAALIPVLEGRLGPNEPFPDWRRISSWLPVNEDACRKVGRPALVELTEDAELGASLGGAAYALLDLDESVRVRLRPATWYALRWRGAGFVRQLRLEHETLVVLGQRLLPESAGPSRVDLAGGSMLQVIRAEVAWAGADPRYAGFGAQPGWLIPAASS